MVGQILLCHLRITSLWHLFFFFFFVTASPFIHFASFALTIIAFKPSATKVNNNGDSGSPCLNPLLHTISLPCSPLNRMCFWWFQLTLHPAHPFRAEVPHIKYLWQTTPSHSIVGIIWCTWSWIFQNSIQYPWCILVSMIFKTFLTSVRTVWLMLLFHITWISKLGKGSQKSLSIWLYTLWLILRLDFHHGHVILTRSKFAWRLGFSNEFVYISSLALGLLSSSYCYTSIM